jgi:hypothetical protein
VSDPLSIDRSESLLILAVHFRGRLCWLIQQADSAGRKAASQTNKNNTPPIRVSMMEAAFCRDFLKSERSSDAETNDSTAIHRRALTFVLDNRSAGFSMELSPPIPVRIEWADSQGRVTASWLAAHFSFPRIDVVSCGGFMGRRRPHKKTQHGFRPRELAELNVRSLGVQIFTTSLQARDNS